MHLELVCWQTCADVRLRADRGLFHYFRGGSTKALEENIEYQLGVCACGHLIRGSGRANYLTDSCSRGYYSYFISLGYTPQSTHLPKWPDSRRRAEVVETHFNPTDPHDSEVILVGMSGSDSEGIVALYNTSNYRWSTICNTGWDNSDADVVCKQLGFKGGASTSYR